MKYALPAAVFAALAYAAAAQAATFVAEVKGNTVTVYSTSKKKEDCQLKNTFSYVFKGDRLTTTQSCSVHVVPGARQEVCHVTHSDIVEGKIEKPIEVVSCADEK